MARWGNPAFASAITLVAANGSSWCPPTELHASQAGASAGAVKALGALDPLAAAGLVLPKALGIAPVTATCLIALMIGAMFAHGRLGQYKLVAVNIAYLAVEAFIAVGRY